ncbi:precorrin-6A synthase (deacetylating) [Pseudomonas promysalinigenes]|jgi:precorrin-6A synthase|uniref:Precorrin-6A synthase (Deacetylating) n=1 Tax=Pseudomonas promysalinigenes TaxID=485898 RepID=A0ABY6AUP7_9PSED|nr:precorrin-6A synthase (deacetylating) [Pseudomonas promysalinigenes]UXH41921.1 precorrin-6A synthase (deacetylating) [Pseudomonas promysalinigenes]
MKELLLIGIGPGDPRQVTLEAVEALGRATVFFVHDKGPAKQALVTLRKALLDRYRPQGGYRLMQLADPSRDGQAVDYQGAVHDWHRQRAALYARLINQELGEEDIGAFLLWGEPSLYDSTLRILNLVRECGMALRLQVIPGISSVQALAAKHQISLNRVGEPLMILPGRRLAELTRVDNVVVMLDGQCEFANIEDPALMIYWGAYLGTEDEVMIAGPLHLVKSQILEVRERERLRKGWLMDTYLLRREL